MPCRLVGERHEHEPASGYVPARAHGEGHETAGVREHRGWKRPVGVIRG